MFAFYNQFTQQSEANYCDNQTDNYNDKDARTYQRIIGALGQLRVKNFAEVLFTLFESHVRKLIQQLVHVNNVRRVLSSVHGLVDDELDGPVQTPEQTFWQIHKAVESEYKDRSARYTLELLKGF